ncbi:sulfotransferase 1A1-like [Amphiura filiformis]|uniref:sulfotransferase 1A1-like n=1 Tax=Amphiura filiformis TaxID=82378 RepID=UPI003B2137C3
MADENPEKKDTTIPIADLANLRGDLPPEVVHEGVLFPWHVSERAVKALKDYDVRDDDIWVTTYPKAGTHWTAEIVNLVLADGHEEKIDRTKQPMPIELDHVQPGTKIPEHLPSHMRIPQYERCKSFPSPRVLMTHLPEHMMPKQIYKGKGKVIFVLRNPKDSAVSFWHFVRPGKFNPKHELWDTLFEEFCTDETIWGGYFKYNLQFWKKHRHDKTFLFLKYEDMQRDLRGAVVQIADFLGRPLSVEAIERVVNKSTLDSMKQRFHTVDQKSGKNKIGVPATIRKGIVGDWKTQFTVAQNETFDKLYREKLEGSDLHMDFEIKRYYSTATIMTS